MKLPTVFTTLNLQGFDVDSTIQHSSINRQMVDVACQHPALKRRGFVPPTLGS